MKIKSALFMVLVLFFNGHAKTALVMKANMIEGINSEIESLRSSSKMQTGLLVANLAQRECVMNSEIDRYKIKKCRLVFKNTLKYERAKAILASKIQAKRKNRTLLARARKAEF